MGFCIRGASVVGASHVKNNTPCQDALAYKIIAPFFAVIAVSDGLGTVEKSDLGSHAAVQAVVRFAEDYLAAHPPDQIDLPTVAKQTMLAARTALVETALALQCDLKDLGCTLISIVMMRDSMAVAHCGDGAVIARSDTALFIASPPGESEYLDIVTPITTDDWQDYLRISPVINEVRDAMAFTDGCQRAVLKKTKDGCEPFEPFCRPVLDYFRASDDDDGAIAQLKHLLSSRKLCENSDDDKTLVVITGKDFLNGQEIF
jgi:hypothetical protein